MRIEGWDRDPLGDQESVFGRDKVEGAPLTGTRETDVPDYAAKRPTAPGHPAWTPTSGWPHPRTTTAGPCCAAATPSPTVSTRASGELDAGLFFIAFMRDPPGVRRPAAQARRPRRAERVHRARRQRALRLPRRGARPGRRLGPGPVRLTRPVRDQSGRRPATKKGHDRSLHATRRRRAPPSPSSAPASPASPPPTCCGTPTTSSCSRPRTVSAATPTRTTSPPPTARGTRSTAGSSSTTTAPTPTCAGSSVSSTCRCTPPR